MSCVCYHNSNTILNKQFLFAQPIVLCHIVSYYEEEIFLFKEILGYRAVGNSEKFATLVFWGRWGQGLLQNVGFPLDMRRIELPVQFSHIRELLGYNKTQGFTFCHEMN
ncbi:hypothetical protein KIL84_017864 [Mauremys mutica]|uniref:Uncharacterized protein n=1 Tax=Mauremys mutica TaxID=74926 RepID=A0A9D3X7B8_9SAUR|nr:hypothetical protein KIL84_017864 [Mauremys mutica]